MHGGNALLPPGIKWLSLCTVTFFPYTLNFCFATEVN